MKIKIWGCRGSTASPGPDTVRYGGNSTCVEVRSSDGRLLVLDAGSGIRNLGKALQKEPIRTIRFFFTHAHWDHLAGFPFFLPAYMESSNITFCSGPHSQHSIARYISRQMEAPFFPVEFKHLKARFDFRCESPKMKNGDCPLGGIQCRPFPLNHPNGGSGYKFIESGKSFVFLTDNEIGFRHQGGLTREQYVELCRDADLLLHDAQYTDEEYRYTAGWGHSTYRDALDLAMEAGVKRLGLFHHDPDRSDQDLDRRLEICLKHIEQSGSKMECFVSAEGMTVEV